MAQRKRQTLKTYFEVGDIPTQQQYHDWIESNVMLSDVNSGSIQLTGSINLVGVNGNLTASQNISASGNVYAASFEPNVVTSGIVSSSATSSTSSFGTEVVLDNNTILQSKDTSGNVQNLAYITNGNITSLADPSLYTNVYGAGIKLDSGNDIIIDAMGSDVHYRAGGVLNTVSIHTQRGDITASGNISASGTIYANDFRSTGEDIAGITFADDLNLTGDITASGNIKAGGYISASSVNTTALTIAGAVYGQSTDTFWASGSSGKIYYNGGNIGIGTTTPGSELEVIGHISASGTISASAIYADTIYTSGSTLYVGNEAFSQEHLSDLKQGKTIISSDRRKTLAATGDAEEIEASANYIRPQIIFHETDDESAIIHKTAGRWFFRSPGGDPFEIYANGLGGDEKQDYIRLGSTTTKTTQVRIPGAISASKTNAEHVIGGNTTFKGNVIVTGSLEVSGSSTFTNWGNFRNRMHKDKHAFEISTNPYAHGGFRDHLTPGTPALTGSAPHLHFMLSGSGQAGVGTLSPQHTLHVSASSGDFNALQVDGDAVINGCLTANSIGNPSTISNNTIVPAGYNVQLITSFTNPSITIAAGVNYTISAGADVSII